MKEQKALVVFSGGQDSTTCLLWALQQFKEVEAVTFNYGQRHAAELEVAAAIAAEWRVNHHVLDLALLNQLAPSALTRADIAITEQTDEPPSTFVEGRNMLFFSFAAILAKGIGAKHIVTGVSETDFSGYPDCRDVFIKSLNVTLNLAMDTTFVLDTPLMWLDKAGVWRLADQLQAFEYVQEKTLTCYNGIIAAGCGTCPACKLRNNGLKQYLLERANEQTLYEGGKL